MTLRPRVCLYATVQSVFVALVRYCNCKKKEEEKDNNSVFSVSAHFKGTATVKSVLVALPCVILLVSFMQS